MLTRSTSHWLLSWTAVFCLAFTSCATPRVESQVKKRTLSDQPPQTHDLNLKESTSQFPAKPPREEVEVATTREIKSVEREELDFDAQSKFAAEVAKQNPRVGKALGEQFAYFETEQFEGNGGICLPEKPVAVQAAPAEPDSPIARLTYFSYSFNTTVAVCMRGEQVVSVGQRKGYQPPESEGEIDKAVRLSKADARLKGKVEGLNGRAILIEPESGLFGDLGGGNRVLWVTFSKQGEGDPLFWAIVDLTTDKVLDAGIGGQQ